MSGRRRVDWEVIEKGEREPAVSALRGKRPGFPNSTETRRRHHDRN